VIPNDVTNVVTVDKSKFVEVINRLLYLADAESRGIHIEIKKDGDYATLRREMMQVRVERKF